MDPNLFHIDWAQLAEVLTAVVVLAFILERALALVFEHRWYVNKLDGKGFKAIIAYVVALLICLNWDFDVVAVVMSAATTTVFGKIITAGVIAGGSKAAIKLFHDVMKMGPKPAQPVAGGS